MNSYFLLTTHFSDYLKEDLLRGIQHPIQYKQMNVLLDQSSSQAITPLYQVIDGICQDSLGIRCAASLGLLSNITNRAQEVGVKITPKTQIYDCIHENKDVPLDEDLLATKNEEQVKRLMKMVFETKDWNCVSKEELDQFLTLLGGMK